MFKPMTTQQRDVYKALRELGEMVVLHDDARPLQALKRRGLVRFRRDEHGVKIAVLRCSKAERLAGDRDERAVKAMKEWWAGGRTRADLHERWG